MHLIVGASGTLGTQIARRLLSSGAAVRGVSRDIGKLATLKELGMTPVRGDLKSSDWMSKALEGVRVLILSSHGLVPPTRDNHPGVVDAIGNRRMIDAARQAGVEHIVFVSAAPVAGQATLFTTTKQEVEAHLKGSGVGYTVVRPTVFIETHALILLAEPLRDKGAVIFLGSGAAALNWVSAEDVAEYVVRASSEAPRNRIDTIGGPDNLSRLEVLSIIEKSLGKTARRTHVPVGVMRVMRTVVGAVHPGVKYLLDMAVVEAGTRNGAPAVALDWTGPTRVADVVQRWAGT